MQKKYKITVNGQSYDVAVEELGSSTVSAVSAPAASAAPLSAPAAPQSAGKAGCVKAPMPGTVLSTKVAAGQAVKRGQLLLILEAMKMENEITAPADGTVSAVHVHAGSTVNTGDPMVDLS